MRRKASITVEAALLCPVLCFILIGMLQFTLRLYEMVDVYALKLVNLQQQKTAAPELIRLEAVAEDIF